MVRLSHSVFKLILSYKDPRYERVRNGDPYMATPTRVWYTKGERRQATDPYKDASMYETPSSYHWGTPAIERFGPESQPRFHPRMDPIIVLAKEYNVLWEVKLRVIGKYFWGYDKHTQYVFDPRKLETHDWKDEEAIEMLSLQCEACGPDLELYEMMRRRQ